MYTAITLPSATVIFNGASTVEQGQTYTVTRVRVVEGHVFDIYLENGKRYLVALHGVPGTPPETKDQVVRCLNEHREGDKKLVFVPRIWDEHRQRYVGDIYLDGTCSMSLTDWLTIKGLTYSR
jgi:hypothetical protein